MPPSENLVKKWTLLFAGPHRRKWRNRPRRWVPPFRKSVYYIRHRSCTIRLTWAPFVGMAVTALWRPSPLWSPSDPPSFSWEFHAMKKRSVPAGADGEPNRVEMASAVLKGHVSLVEHCACTRWEDGTPREPGWITIGTSGSSWTVTVKEPDACASFRVVAPTIDQALDTAALLLACEEAPWERDRFLEEQRKRKKK